MKTRAARSREPAATGLAMVLLLGASCTVTEADADDSPFLAVAVPLETPDPPGPRVLEIERRVWTTQDCAPGERREARRRLTAVDTTRDGYRLWSSVTVEPPVDDMPGEIRFEPDGGWPAPDSLPRPLRDLVTDEAARATTPWADDLLHPGNDVLGGAAWVLDPEPVLASPLAGPLRGMPILAERSSGYAHTAALLPYDDSLTWSVEGHLRLAPAALPDAVVALWTELLGDRITALSGLPPEEATAAIQLRQRGTLPHPTRRGTRRDETLEFRVRWLVDGRFVEAGLTEHRIRRATSP